MIDLRFSLAGLIVGLLVGITGVGGSSILAPILILFLGIKPLVTVGTDLLYSVPTKLLATVVHWRARNIEFGVLVRLLVGGAPGVAVGLLLLSLLRAHMSYDALNIAVKHWVGVAILLAAAGTILVAFRARKVAESDVALSLDTGASVKLVLTGFVTGWLVSLTSVGSGSLTLPLLMFALPKAQLRRLIGSEIAYAAFIIPAAAMGHSFAGDIDWGASISLVVGSLPGAYVGSKLCARVDEKWLRPVIVGALAFAGSRLI